MRKEREFNKRIARRARRTRAKLRNTSDKPRLSVFRSNNNIHAQIIDDLHGKTLAGASSLEIKGNAKENKTKLAEKVGENLAKKALEAGVKEVVFDKGRYRYHGRIKALADGARKGGLSF